MPHNPRTLTGAVNPACGTIIIAQRWLERLGRGCVDIVAANSLRGFVQRLRGMGRRVILVAPAVELDSPYTLRAYRLGTDRSKHRHLQGLSRTEAEYGKQMRFILETLGNLEREGLCHVLHIENALFKDGVFHAMENGEWLMYDDNHLSPAGSLKAVRGCREELLRFLQD